MKTELKHFFLQLRLNVWISLFMIDDLCLFWSSSLCIFLFPVQNKPLPAEAAVAVLQKEVCRENSGDKTQS